MLRKVYLTIALLMCSLIIGTGSGNCAGEQVNSFEYEVKSACILNFFKFIHIAPAETNDKSQTINIALVGDSPAIEVIQKTLQNKTADNKHIILNRYPDVGHLLKDNRVHHAVYFVAPWNENITEALPSLRNVARLTISESPDFCQKGGMINFRIDNGKVRLDINPAAAKQANIKISSQLLKLAHIIEQPSVTAETPKQDQKKQ